MWGINDSVSGIDRIVMQNNANVILKVEYRCAVMLVLDQAARLSDDLAVLTGLCHEPRGNGELTPIRDSAKYEESHRKAQKYRIDHRTFV